MSAGFLGLKRQIAEKDLIINDYKKKQTMAKHQRRPEVSSEFTHPPSMIDLYDVLGVSVDADEEEIKRAHERITKKAKNGAGKEAANTERFDAVEKASEVLLDAARRKIYDAFGTDLGDETPATEVWCHGSSLTLQPLSVLGLKVLFLRLVLWAIAFRLVSYLWFLASVIATILYVCDFKRVNIRDQEYQALLLVIALVQVVIFLLWCWPVLADTLGVIYIIMDDFPGINLAGRGWPAFAGALFGSFFFAWLVQGSWYWILLGLLGVGVILVGANCVAVTIVHVWAEAVQTQHTGKLRALRLGLRKNREQLSSEMAEVRAKLNRLEGKGRSSKR